MSTEPRQPTPAALNLADHLREAFPAWRRSVSFLPSALLVLSFGCGHKISGSYMAEAVVVIASLEP